MEILEFGDRNKRKIIFIHGFQCPYQIWEKYIEHYQKDYHIIIPIMPGHNPKKQEKFQAVKEATLQRSEVASCSR